MFQLCFQNSNKLWRNYFKSSLYGFTLTMAENFSSLFILWREWDIPLSHSSLHTWTQCYHRALSSPCCGDRYHIITQRQSSSTTLVLCLYHCCLLNQQVAHPNFRWKFTLFQIIWYSTKLQQTLYCLCYPWLRPYNQNNYNLTLHLLFF